MKIFVGNLSWDATEDDLRQLFEKHGAVVSVHIVKDPYTGRSKGFAFIEMSDEASGDNAIRELNDYEFLSRPLRVSRARQEGSREDRPSRGPGGPRGDRGDRPPRKPYRPRFEEAQYT